MKITVPQTKKIEIEVELPLFFKTEYEVIAFYENIQIRVFQINEHVTISKRPLEETDLVKCLDKQERISEEEFEAEFNKAMESLKAYNYEPA